MFWIGTEPRKPPSSPTPPERPTPIINVYVRRRRRRQNSKRAPVAAAAAAAAMTTTWTRMRLRARTYNNTYAAAYRDGNVQRPVHVRAFRGYRNAVARATTLVAGGLRWARRRRNRECVMYVASAPTRMLRADRPAAAAADQ